MQIAAIVPAYNEEKTIYDLVRVLKSSGLFSEVIVVSDGSSDRTGELARSAGAQVITLSDNLGKGGAMSVGVSATKASVVLFFDADLSGVKREHLLQLTEPLLKDEADMVVGIRPELQEVYKLGSDLPVLSGQRAMKREIFEQVPVKLRKGYQIEEALNYYCKTNNQQVKLIVLAGLEHLQKIPKSDLVRGTLSYLKMIFQIAKIFVIVRVMRIFKK